MKEFTEMLWGATVSEIMQGYVFNPENGEFICLICGKSFTQGVIYKEDSILNDAARSISLHCERDHSGVFGSLLDLGRKYTGLTEHTETLLRHFYEGLNDGEIVKKLGGGSTSTVRNHRFILREREKQSRIFCAIMGLLERKMSKKQRFIPIHRSATRVDERYAITEEERDAVLKAHFKDGPDGPLSRFPKKEKKKIAILTHIAKRFARDRRYSEKQVNDILRKVYADYVTIRRYLIEYGFMDREKDGSQYWLNM